MYQDAALIVSGTVVGNTVAGQSFVGTGTILSANCIDLGAKRDMGEGEDLKLRAQITAACAGATSIEFQAVTADDSALAANLAVVASTGAIPIASLTVGARFVAGINPRIGSLGQRYLGARAVIVGTTTAGAALIDFGIDLEDGAKSYPSGFAIS